MFSSNSVYTRDTTVVPKAGDVLRGLMNYERSNSRKQGHVELMLYDVLCELDRNFVQVSVSCGPQSARAQFIVDAQTVTRIQDSGVGRSMSYIQICGRVCNEKDSHIHTER